MKKVALVYDRLNKIGGAEVILNQLHQLWPQAPWYTSVYRSDRLRFTQNWQVKTSFLQSFPYLSNHHELVPYLMPFVFENFDFSTYNLVISVSSAEAKGIITKPETFHLHYCLTPTRYLWSHAEAYLQDNQFGLLKRLGRPLVKSIHHWLRRWDLVAASRPDAIIAISQHVRQRIKKYYNREAQVVYPPVEIAKFSQKHQPPRETLTGYYLTVARLVPYKKIDFLLQAFASLPNQKLVVIGDGVERNRLQRIAPPNVVFKGFVSENKLVSYYQYAKAFLQVNEEDFGIAMVEAQAAGTPVLAYKGGGAKEIITPKTGLLFSKPQLDSFLHAFAKLETIKFSKADLKRNAKRFEPRVFRQQFSNLTKELWNQHIQKLKTISM